MTHSVNYNPKPFFRNINPKDVAELLTKHVPNIENMPLAEIDRRFNELAVTHPHLNEEKPAVRFYEVRRRDTLAKLHADSQRPIMTANSSSRVYVSGADYFNGFDRA